MIYCVYVCDLLPFAVLNRQVFYIYWFSRSTRTCYTCFDDDDDDDDVYDWCETETLLWNINRKSYDSLNSVLMTLS